jgi:hypothetical protein
MEAQPPSHRRLLHRSVLDAIRNLALLFLPLLPSRWAFVYRSKRTRAWFRVKELMLGQAHLFRRSSLFSLSSVTT